MKYECPVCGYVYDEREQGRAWDELPDDWECPICGASKSVFKPVGSPEQPIREQSSHKHFAPPAHGSAQPSGNDVKLTPGELSAIFSNLARGCEKQYKDEECALFAELAAHYASLVPPQGGGLEELTEAVRRNADEQFAYTKSVAAENGDRGALRSLVWGEKVNTVLKSLIERYVRDGEEFLKSANIWVCSICGFIYIGDTPPEICPVCKVPSFRFEKGGEPS